jgi:hypothetical protein
MTVESLAGSAARTTDATTHSAKTIALVGSKGQNPGVAGVRTLSNGIKLW